MPDEGVPNPEAAAADTKAILAKSADLEAAGDLVGAIRLAQQAVRAAPESFQPRLVLARMFLRKARAGERHLMPLAVREFENAVRLVPSEREAHERLLEVAAQAGRLDELTEAYAGRWKDLPFASEMGKTARAVALAAPDPTAHRAFRFPEGKLPWGAGIALAISLGVYVAMTQRAATRSGAPPYAPGTNLVSNGDAERGLDGWEHTGAVTIRASGGPVFHLAGDDAVGAGCWQEIRLPDPLPPVALVIARTRAEQMPADQMSGLPSLWGCLKDRSGKPLAWLSGYNTTHKAPAGEWGVCWGTYDLGADAATLQVYLQQALQAGGTRAGNPAEFDDVAVYLFNSKTIAETFARTYAGVPPSAVVLDDDAKAAQAAAAPLPAQEQAQVYETPPGVSFKDAKAKFDKLMIGMARSQAADILQHDLTEDQYKVKYTLAFSTLEAKEDIVLTVYFADNLVGRVTITRVPNPPVPGTDPKLLAEKGDTNLK